MQDERTVVVRHTADFLNGPTRRGFLKALGVGGSIVLMPSLFAACTDTTTAPIGGNTSTDPLTISLATDVGIFQFAYVLEQLESSFYEQLVGLSTFMTLFNGPEQELLTDLRNDEVTHREFLRTILGTTIPNLTFNFAAVPITNAGLLGTALALETTGVGAYNGAGYALKNASNLLMAGKIVSVEARHASAIADAIDARATTPTGTLYADLSQTLPLSLGANVANALDAAASASTVAANAQPFIVNKITLA